MDVTNGTEQEAGRSTARVAGLEHDVELVLVSYRSAHQIRALLAGLPDDLPVVVVDNASDVDGLSQLPAERPATRYVDSGGGKGFAKAANMGARTSTHEYVVFGNPDSRPTLEHLATLVADVAADPGLAASAATMAGVNGHVELGVGAGSPRPPAPSCTRPDCTSSSRGRACTPSPPRARRSTWTGPPGPAWRCAAAPSSSSAASTRTSTSTTRT